MFPTVTENGVTFFRSDLTPHTSVVNADGENTTVDLTIDSVTLNFTKDTVVLQRWWFSILKHLCFNILKMII